MASDNGYSLRTENRGNEDMKDLYEDLGIRKGVTGHFHESVGRAHDMNCVPVVEGELSRELFWNASYLDGLKAGILSVEGEKAAYQNVDLKNYMG